MLPRSNVLKTGLDWPVQLSLQPVPSLVRTNPLTTNFQELASLMETAEIWPLNYQTV